MPVQVCLPTGEILPTYDMNMIDGSNKNLELAFFKELGI